LAFAGGLTDYRVREALHFLELRAELEQYKVNACGSERCNAFGDLFWSADKSASQPTVGHRIIFQRNALFELCPRKPLLVVGVARRGLLHVGDATQFVLRLFFRFANDGVTRDAEFQRCLAVLSAAGLQD